MMRTTVLLLAALAAAAIAWYFGGAGQMQRLSHKAAAIELPAAGVIRVPGLESAAAPARPQPAAGPRKCLTQGRVLYTNEACPAGSREADVSGGTVTTVPGQPVSPRPAADARPLGSLRDTVHDPAAPSLKDQRMEAVIGR